MSNFESRIDREHRVYSFAVLGELTDAEVNAMLDEGERAASILGGGGPWALLGDLRGAPPVASLDQRLVRMNQLLFEGGCDRVAMVVDVTTTQMQLRRVSREAAGGGFEPAVEHRFFESVEEARDWLGLGVTV